MTVSELLAALRAAQVVLSAEGDRLKCAAPPGALTPELSAAIREHKPALLALLGETGAGRPAEVDLPRAEDQSRAPLSATQQRIAIVARNAPGLPAAFRMRGPLSVPALKSTLHRIVHRHATLRLQLDLQDSAPAQIFRPWVTVDLDEVSLEALPPSEREPELRRRLALRSAEPMDVETGLPFRFGLYRLEDNHHVLWVCFSTLAFDGWSFDVFLRELREGYAALAADAPWPLPEPPASYADAVAWQRARIAARGEAQRAFWRKLHGPTVMPPALPHDRPRPPVSSYKGHSVGFALRPGLPPTVRRIAKSHDVTVQMVMLAAVGVWLSRLGGRPDVVIAAPIESRTHPALEVLIGPFVNTLLLRLHADPASTFADQLRAVRELCLAAYEQQDVPLDELGLRTAARPQGTGFAPLYEVQFSFQQVSTRSALMGSVTLEQFDVHSGRTNVDLTLWVKDTGQQIAGAIEFSADLFDQETVLHWAGAYETLLAGMLAAVDQPLGTIDLLGDALPTVQAAEEKALAQLPAEARAAAGGKTISGLRIVDGTGLRLPLGVPGTLQLTLEDRTTVEAGRARLLRSGQLGPADEQTAPKANRVRAASDTPIDALERSIIDDFAELFDNDRARDRDASFFDLGGHSLVAVKLLNRIHRRHKINLPLAALFAAPSPRELASLVRQELQPAPGSTTSPATAWTTVVPIQPRGRKIPFFAVAGVGGNPMNLRHLARHLGDDQPFYGLQHRGTDGKLPPHLTIEAAAREFLEHIRRVQPHGPYLLGGFSAGGIAAYELAQQLRRLGDHVGVVVMLDAASPTAAASTVVAAEKRSRHLAELRRHGLRYLIDHGKNRAQKLAQHLQLRVGARLAQFFPYEFREQAVIMAWLDARARYQPQPYDGDVVVLRATTRDNWVFHENNGWGDLVRGRLRVVPVEGGHTSHVDEAYAAGTARALAEVLSSVTTSPTSTVRAVG